MAFGWTEDLATGEKQLDSQHKTLFKVFSAIRDACAGEATVQEVSNLLKKLDRAAAKHFEAEEHLLETCGYNNLERHQEAHADFVERVGSMRQILELHGPQHRIFDIARAGLAFWLLEHIRSEDRAYRSCLAGDAPLPVEQPY